tara:strand:- start:765 stop:2033 length:1269 start_codon:yes stop_codon:yes gene_type:complete
MRFDLNDKKIAIVGLGYVGLPLALEFSKHFSLVGFDINQKRLNELSIGFDRTKEVEKSKLLNSTITFSNNIDKLKDCNIYIITVPTPIDSNNRPDLNPLISATRMVGRVLKKNDIVIYESTVYPGCTEEECVPVLEKESQLVYNKDFFCGYSPERINPGDKDHSLTKICKVTSGSNPKISQLVDKLYNKIIIAGTHLCSSIKVAETAKVIENSQRDINIAFVNELAKILKRMDIDVHEVIDAASTKWNFLPFRPGLVGGHCIGVDPYYLAQKAEQLGYHPEIILSGRRVNDSMGAFIASDIVKLLLRSKIDVNNASILILGITFKENCPDIRNTKVIEIYNELNIYNLDLDVYDPWADHEEVFSTLGINMIKEFNDKKYDGIILSVGHDEFLKLDFDKMKKKKSLLYDVKGILNKELSDRRL